MAFDDPKTFMERFAEWIRSVCQGQPMFISDNHGIDWQFINWYLHHFLNKNPFGHSSTRCNGPLSAATTAGSSGFWKQRLPAPEAPRPDFLKLRRGHKPTPRAKQRGTRNSAKARRSGCASLGVAADRRKAAMATRRSITSPVRNHALPSAAVTSTA